MKILKKIILIRFQYIYSFYIYINSIIFYTLYININFIIIVFNMFLFIYITKLI